MTRHHKHHPDREAVNARDARRKALLAKAAETIGLPETDLRSETLSWLLLSLDIAKQEMLRGRLSDIGPWQRVVEAMQSACPKSDTLTVKFVDADLSAGERDELRSLRRQVEELRSAARQMAAKPAENYTKGINSPAVPADAPVATPEAKPPSNVTALKPPKRPDTYTAPAVDSDGRPRTGLLKGNSVAELVSEVNLRNGGNYWDGFNK